MVPFRFMTARDEALRRLRRIEQEGAYAGLLQQEDDRLDARDVRFATELAAGVTRWRRYLDFLITHYYRGAFVELEPDLKIILRIGLYELLILEAPPHAAVNEAVETARRNGHRKASGLVNGILRTVVRAGDARPEPETGDPARDLAIRFSHPTWMVRRWLDRFEAGDVRTLLEWNNSRPVYGLRVNKSRVTVDAFRGRLDDEGVEWQPSPFADDFVRVQSLQPVFRAGLIRDGWCVVQDEAAGLVVRVLDPKPNERIADACAAPGGKAVYAAVMMEGTGEVFALDVNERRTKLITETAARLGLPNVRVNVGDAREIDSIAELDFDRVLLDAPCSGSGVMNKRADLRWRRTPEQFEELVTLQRELIDACARVVKPGGLLVYGTCSIEAEENEEQVRRFLERNPGFSLESVEALVDSALVSADGFYRSLPHVHGIDGAFAARLRRRA